MLALHVTFKNQLRKTRFPKEETSFEILEARVRQLFRLWGKPILIFYQENENHNIILLDDEDVKGMCACLAQSQKTVALSVKLRSNSLVELGNLHVIQRCCIKDLRRKHLKRDILAKKKLKKDLMAIRKSLIAAQIKPHLIKELVRKISLEVELFLIEKIFENDGTQNCGRRALLEPFNLSKSSINPLSKSCPSLFSRTENRSKIDYELHPMKTVQRFDSNTQNADTGDDPFEADDLWVDHLDEPNPRKVLCCLCGKSLNHCIVFRCQECQNFQVCESCAREQGANDKHVLLPFFEIPKDKKGCEAIRNVFVKIGSRLMDSAWLVFKDFMEKT